MLIFLQVAKMFEDLGSSVIEHSFLIDPTHPLTHSQPPEVGF